MFYKIRNDILFRQYDHHGYITDNSDYGYRFLDDSSSRPGETFVSESGAIMLSTLGKSPRNIENIADDLMRIFRGVGREDLKSDVVDFFRTLVEKGYLSEGLTALSCIDRNPPSLSESSYGERAPIVPMEDCAGGVMGPNDFLRSIHFDVAGACNEHCVHCYIPDECKKKTIKTSLFLRILEEARNLNAIHVTLSGGEPLLHKNFNGLLERCRELDLSVNVLSNLTLLSDDHVSEMAKNPLLSVQASLYSMDPLVHDSTTGLTGSFNKTVNGILRLIEAGIPVQISCPVMKQNKDSFLDVVVWGRDHNVAVAINPVIFASYDHSGSNLDNRISLDELDTVLDKEMSEGYASVMQEAASEKELLTGKDPVCSVCRYSLCVSVEGNVFPCAGWQSNVVGNLNVSTLKEVWEESEKIRWLRGIKREAFPKCVNCENRGYCTVCMMTNANEDPDGNPFFIDKFHCAVASKTRRKVLDFLESQQGTRSDPQSAVEEVSASDAKD
ncbi:MAG: radical SAM protein [Eggerthellaceae bacterium]|nr:radical SAM protein [Eggerthellaceae bacterium]